MKRVTYAVMPWVLASMLSACSTQTTQTDTTTVRNYPSTSVLGSSLPAPSAEKIQRLRQQLMQSQERSQRLADQLDDKERTISDLARQELSADQLARLERLKNERDNLEQRYNSQRLQSSRLNERLYQIAPEQQALALEPEDYMPVNKSFRTLDSERYAVSKDYRDLSIEYAELKSQHQTLQQERASVAQTLQQLSDEKQALNEELAQIRGQQQVLWDKIRVQGNVIDSLEATNAELNTRGGFVAAANQEADNNVQEVAQLEARITRLQAEIDAQNQLIRNHQAQINSLTNSLVQQETDHESELSALQQRYQSVQQRNSALSQRLAAVSSDLEQRNQQIAALERQLANSQTERRALESRLTALAEEHEQTEQAVVELQARHQQVLETRTNLESQVNKLIAFEGAVTSLQQQLQSGIENARWSLPTSANLNDTFEIRFSADVANPIEGQTFYAELIVDSALNMISAAEAESVVDNGRVNFRWRLSGLNERPNATMNVAVSQNVNYDGQQILRKVYRDSETVELISTDWLSKYGYWAIAILGGLLLGYGASRIGTRGRDS
ncbi:hypothetical protein [Marinomonas ostreistagni]|uniref:hypothetical protein n=1 Tax=Marinomonas ostreistagni TaxID=359209 RepID=UPI00195198CD|nr:hypothetical protein [Marinomonas ostreistagni]MBM6550241.1 hypothetical protein [Marinomonas ostreistagni]